MKKLFLAVVLTLTATTASAINVPLYTIDDYRAKVIAMKKEYAEVDKIVTEHIKQDKIHDYELKIIELGVGDRCGFSLLESIVKKDCISFSRDDGSEIGAFSVSIKKGYKKSSIDEIWITTEGQFYTIQKPLVIFKMNMGGKKDKKYERIEWADVAIKRKHLREKIDFIVENINVIRTIATKDEWGEGKYKVHGKLVGVYQSEPELTGTFEIKGREKDPIQPYRFPLIKDPDDRYVILDSGEKCYTEHMTSEEIGLFGTFLKLTSMATGTNIDKKLINIDPKNPVKDSDVKPVLIINKKDGEVFAAEYVSSDRRDVIVLRDGTQLTISFKDMYYTTVDDIKILEAAEEKKENQ